MSTAETSGQRDGFPAVVAIMWLLVSAALIWSGRAQLVALEGWDPDDALRLVQLRDFLGGQGWFDTTQYRMNPPDGAPMHWSRLIELPLAAIVLLLRPLFGQPVAEMIAGTAVPLLLLGWITFMIARITTVIGSREAGIAAALITLSSGALLLQLRPMRIDHHGWQLAMAVLALSTIFWPNVRRAGLTLGVALAVWLHISLEGAPMTAAFFLLLGVRWIRDAGEGEQLSWTVASFATSSLLLYFGTQASGLNAAMYCDTVSPQHIIAIGFAAAIMLPAIRFLPDDMRFRLGAVAVIGLSAIAVILTLSPQCTSGAFGNMDPLVREYWYSKVNEGLPVWHQPWRTVLHLFAGLICGALSWIIFRPQAKGNQRLHLATIGFFLFYGLLLSLLVVRTISVATTYAIPVTAILIAHLFKQYRQSSVPAKRITLVAAMLALLVPGAVLSTVLRAVPDKTEESAATVANGKCESARSLRSLAGLPTGVFLAPFDLGPTILAQTPHSVLASSHHRNEQAMHDHIQIFRSEPAAAHRLMQARGIDYLAVCPDEGELGNYARQDPKGLWAHISRGNVPSWLEPLADRGNGIKLWRVR